MINHKRHFWLEISVKVNIANFLKCHSMNSRELHVYKTQALVSIINHTFVIIPITSPSIVNRWWITPTHSVYADFPLETMSYACSRKRAHTFTWKVSTLWEQNTLEIVCFFIKVLQVHQQLGREAELLREVCLCLVYRCPIKTKTVPNL